MKRTVALLCGAVLISSMAACMINSQVYDETASPSADAGATLTPSEFSEADFDASGDIVLATEYEIYGGDAPKVSYTIKNNTPEELVYGLEYSVEVFLDGMWYQVPFPENTAWDALGVILKANDINTGSFSFSFLDYTFKDGRYRLIKNIGDKRYFAEFRVGPSPITAGTPFGYTALEKLPEDYIIEEAVQNGDVVITYNEIKNAGRLTEFINKVSIGMPSMVRFVQYTVEGDPIISDFVFSEGHRGYYLYRHDNSRDKFGANGGIKETIYSYLITNGTDLYLSNCASWELTGTYPNADLLQITWAADQGDLSDLVGLAGKLTEERLVWNRTRYKVYSPNGEQSVSLHEEKLTYGYEKPGFGETRGISDPEGIAAEITDAVWLDEGTYVLVCDTNSNLKYFEVVGGTDVKSGYGTGYKIIDGRFDILQ